jgi:hypothetical protein
LALGLPTAASLDLAAIGLTGSVAAARLAHDERTFRTVAAHLDAETRCRLGEEALQSDTSRIGLQP